jgi:hypothetical protein
MPTSLPLWLRSMSQLPKGTKATATFLENFALDGAMVAATAYAPFLGWPVIKDIAREILKHVLFDHVVDESESIAIAARYAADRRRFDQAYLDAKLLDNLNPGNAQEKLDEILKAQRAFIRRGPVQ